MPKQSRVDYERKVEGHQGVQWKGSGKIPLMLFHLPRHFSMNDFLGKREKILVLNLSFMVRLYQGGITWGPIPYHVGSYWGIFIEGKMT